MWPESSQQGTAVGDQGETREQLVSKVVEGLLSRRGPGIFWAEEELGPLLSLILGRE